MSLDLNKTASDILYIINIMKPVKLVQNFNNH